MTKEQKFSDALAVQVERRIFLVRGQKVMLDTDLAELYRVPTKSLNLAVKRNADRFPEDFTFQLTDDEAAGLRFHFETSKRGRRSSAISALTNRREQIIISTVSASEIIKELPKLSEAERRAILDKLRELARQDDERWEQLLNDPQPRPKLEAFLRESAAEGESPLDPSRL
jgi:hypothetical protein